MKKKEFGMPFLFLQIYVANLWAIGDKALIVELQEGNKAEFVLSKSPILTFANKVLQIEINGSSNNFELNDVKQFYFDDASTGISPISSTDVRIICQDNNRIVIEGINETDKVQLYSVDGKMMNNRVEVNRSRAEISLTSLPKGIYLINVPNKQTFKIRRK